MATAKKTARKKPAPKQLPATSLDSFKCRRTLKVGTKSYDYFSLKIAEKNGLDGIKDVSRDRFVFGFFCTGVVTSRRRKLLRAFKTCGGMRALYTPKKIVRLGEGGFFLCDQGT